MAAAGLMPIIEMTLYKTDPDPDPDPKSGALMVEGVPKESSRYAECGHLDDAHPQAPASIYFPVDLVLGVDVELVKGRPPLGRGGTYIVYAGRFRGQDVAVKMFYACTMEESEERRQRWVGGCAVPG